MRNALGAALLVPLFLSPVLHTSLATSRQHISGDTTYGNATNIPALRVLAYEGDRTALQRLTTLAQEGSRDAALALYTLAGWSDVRVPDSMLAVDLQPFVQQARQGRSEGVLALYSFALLDIERAGTLLTAIDPAPFIAQSRSGSTDATLALLSLAEVALWARLAEHDPDEGQRRAELVAPDLGGGGGHSNGPNWNLRNHHTLDVASSAATPRCAARLDPVEALRYE